MIKNLADSVRLVELKLYKKKEVNERFIPTSKGYVIHLKLGCKINFFQTQT